MLHVMIQVQYSAQYTVSYHVCVIHTCTDDVTEASNSSLNGRMKVMRRFASVARVAVLTSTV